MRREIRSAADVLRAARLKLSKRGAWTRCVLARDKSGAQVPAQASCATQWCAIGAIQAVRPGWYYGRAILQLERAIGNEGISIWNDRPSRTRQQVIAAFKKAEKFARTK